MSPGGERAAPADGIIFDCDGVLVDVSDSYYMTVAATARRIFGILGMDSMPAVDGILIQSFKDTGSYNNEIDLAYSVILLMAAARRARLDPYGAALKESSQNAGIADAARRAAKMADVSDLVGRLAYPGPRSMVQDTFEQIFYGPQMYQAVYGRPSSMREPGLIETERLYINDRIAEYLRGRFGGRIAMVTGRGFRSASRTLGKFMDLFDVGSSAFLEDEPRSMAKPNPKPLISAIARMSLERCIYVGDSVEDHIMAQAAGATFVGVWGSSARPEARRALFERRGAHHTLRDISGLPALLQSC